MALPPLSDRARALPAPSQRCPCPVHWDRSCDTGGLSPLRYRHRASQFPPPVRAARPRAGAASSPGPDRARSPTLRYLLPGLAARSARPTLHQLRGCSTLCPAQLPTAPARARPPPRLPAAHRCGARGHGREVPPPTPHSEGSGRRQGRCRRLKRGQAGGAVPAAPGGAGGAGTGGGWHRDGADAARPRLQPHSPRARWRKRKSPGRAG